ncbi:MAG: hypothetical protein EAZ20_13640 [Bacteroidetes bacterium]|nr:MAG: hypothetical protein EAZ20_13640 [Bacteroidota bacterium]
MRQFFKKKYYFYILFFFFFGNILYANPTDPNIAVTTNFGAFNAVTANLSPAMGLQIFKICAGSQVKLEATSLGTGTLTYRWKEALTSTTISTTNPFIGALPENQYFVEVTDAAGTTTSTIVVQICVETATPINPTITPTGTQVLCNSGTGTLTLTANANNPASNILCTTPAFTYQWFKNNIVLTGETNKTLVLNSLVSNAGDYTVSIRNACGSVVSNPVTVSISNATPQNPTINTNTNSNEICPSGTLTMTASALGSVAQYQWYRNNVLLFTGNPLVATASGTYKVRAINACGFTESTNFFVVISTPPLSVSVGSNPASGQGCGSITLIPNRTGGIPTKYEWFKNSDLVATYNFPFPSGFNYIASQDGLYSVKISNQCGSVISGNRVITIIQPPTEATISTNSSPSLSSTCIPNVTSVLLQATTNASNPTYQWYLDGNEIVGATNATYNATVVGGYSVLASNSCSDFLSDELAIVEVNTPVPTNITLTSAGNVLNSCTGNLLLSCTDAGFGALYEWQKDNVLLATTFVPTFSVTQTGNYKVRAKNACNTSNFSNILSLIIGLTPNAPTLVAPNGNFVCDINAAIVLQTNSVLRPDVIYTWVKDNVEITNPIFSNPLNILQAQSGNYQIKATNVCGTFFSNNITTRFITPPQANAVSILYNPCDVPILLQAQTLGTFLEYKWQLIDGVTNPIMGNQPNFNPSISGVYQLSVRNDCMPLGQFFSSNPLTININATSLPIPTIVSAPVAGIDRICPSSSVVLQAQISGSVTNLGYRWFKNNILIAGQTNQTYTASEGGIYNVEIFSTVNNTCSRVSVPYNLFIRPNPILLISFRGNLEFCEGDSLRLQASAQITPSEFRWKKNGVLLTTGNTYNAKQAATYTLEAVYNTGTLGYPCDLVVSKTIDITTQVAPLPIIFAENGLLKVKEKQISYQWNYNSIPIIGATDSTWLALDAGQYSVTVKNNGGCLGTSLPIYQKGIYEQKTPDIQIIPNPCVENCGVILVGTGEMQLDVLDLKGYVLTPKLTITRRLSIAGQTTFSIEGLPAGVYIIRTQSKEGIKNAKLVVI